jgi:hypothetical protein
MGKVSAARSLVSRYTPTILAIFFHDSRELLGFAGFPPERVLAIPIWAEYFQFPVPKVDIGFNCLPIECHRNQPSRLELPPEPPLSIDAAGRVNSGHAV